MTPTRVSVRRHGNCLRTALSDCRRRPAARPCQGWLPEGGMGSGDRGRWLQELVDSGEVPADHRRGFAVAITWRYAGAAAGAYQGS